jgi:hypothetical protein
METEKLVKTVVIRNNLVLQKSVSPQNPSTVKSFVNIQQIYKNHTYPHAPYWITFNNQSLQSYSTTVELRSFGNSTVAMGCSHVAIRVCCNDDQKYARVPRINAAISKDENKIRLLCFNLY